MADASEPHAARLAADRTPKRSRAAFGDVRGSTDVIARHVVPRDARRPQRGADRARARSRSRSTTTAAKASAARAALMINGVAHGPQPRHRRPASCTCATSRTATTIVHRAVARAGLPGDQGPGRRPQRLRPHHRRRAATSRVNTGSAPDGNAIPVPKDDAERAMDAAACIGCGACVAACPNASAMLFIGAKVVAPGAAAAGPARARARACWRMVAQMDEEGFGNCTNNYECEAACPKEISVRVTRSTSTAPSATGSSPATSAAPRPRSSRASGRQHLPATEGVRRGRPGHALDAPERRRRPQPADRPPRRRPRAPRPGRRRARPPTPTSSSATPSRAARREADVRGRGLTPSPRTSRRCSRRSSSRSSTTPRCSGDHRRGDRLDADDRLRDRRGDRDLPAPAGRLPQLAARALRS